MRLKPSTDAKGLEPLLFVEFCSGLVMLSGEVIFVEC